MQNVESKRDYLRRQTHEQLEIFVMNSDHAEARLRKKLFLLSGCGDFGNHDGMSGSCVDCCCNDRNLFDRCCAFSDMIDSYDKEQLTKSLNN